MGSERSKVASGSYKHNTYQNGATPLYLFLDPSTGPSFKFGRSFVLNYNLFFSSSTTYFLFPLGLSSFYLHFFVLRSLPMVNQGQPSPFSQENTKAFVATYVFDWIDSNASSLLLTNKRKRLDRILLISLENSRILRPFSSFQRNFALFCWSRPLSMKILLGIYLLIAMVSWPWDA